MPFIYILNYISMSILHSSIMHFYNNGHTAFSMTVDALCMHGKCVRKSISPLHSKKHLPPPLPPPHGTSHYHHTNHHHRLHHNHHIHYNHAPITEIFSRIYMFRIQKLFEFNNLHSDIVKYGAALP